MNNKIVQATPLANVIVEEDRISTDACGLFSPFVCLVGGSAFLASRYRPSSLQIF